jgi:hypothetical protein
MSSEESQGGMNEPGDDSGRGPITALKVFAYINLIGGIITALIIWSSGGTVFVSANASRSDANTFSVVLGAIFFAEGIFGCALLLVIAGMAENLIAIRQNTEELLELYEYEYEEGEAASKEA